MNQTESPYTIADLLLLIGECTVELRWLRVRMAQLEAQLKAAEPVTPNGVDESAGEVLTGAG